MIWSAAFRDYLELLIKQHVGNGFSLQYFEPISGGDINHAYKIIGSGANCFIKINDFNKFPDLFVKEAYGLNLIRQTHQVKVPSTIKADQFEGKAFLILEWINSGIRDHASMRNFGERLAKMHLVRNHSFGHHDDNYIATFNQINTEYSDWGSFFIQNRLIPQIQIAENKNLLSSVDLSLFNDLIEKLPTLFPEEKPSLLHGDLWNGNLMINAMQEPVLIDPAVYYGYREVDIAFTKLFGGFSDDFYDSYHDTYPLKKGWEDRCDVWNLYPLLVHLNLFGWVYHSRIKTNLQKIKAKY
jgi:protein-ribulosamine 3-kinase